MNDDLVMRQARRRRSAVFAGLAGAVLLASAGAAQAAGTAAASAAGSAAEERYRQERAACLSGASGQEQASCLREAGAALAEARRGGLADDESPEVLARNAVQRCRRVHPEDRDDCERLARGEGTISGSVRGGGQIKELVTLSVEPVAPGR
jgi:hypothetical protein